MRAAAKAMEKPLVLDNVERWGFLVVERAGPAVLAAAPGQPDTAPDEVGERDAAAQLVEKTVREGHRGADPLPWNAGVTPATVGFEARRMFNRGHAGSAQQIFDRRAGAGEVDHAGMALAQGGHD